MSRNLALWTGVLLGPIVWLIAFETDFALAAWACAARAKPVLYLVWLVALAITAGAGLLAWSQWRDIGREPPRDVEGAIARERLMAMGGVLLSGLMFLIILAQGISSVVLEACQ
jgi:hypothetical protein